MRPATIGAPCPCSDKMLERLGLRATAHRGCHNAVQPGPPGHLHGELERRRTEACLTSRPGRCRGGTRKPLRAELQHPVSSACSRPACPGCTRLLLVGFALSSLKFLRGPFSYLLIFADSVSPPEAPASASPHRDPNSYLHLLF